MSEGHDSTAGKVIPFLTVPTLLLDCVKTILDVGRNKPDFSDSSYSTVGLDELSMGREKRREGVIPRKKEPLGYGFGSNSREKPGGEMQSEMQLLEEKMQTLECT